MRLNNLRTARANNPINPNETALFAVSFGKTVAFNVIFSPTYILRVVVGNVIFFAFTGAAGVGVGVGTGVGVGSGVGAIVGSGVGTGFVLVFTLTSNSCAIGSKS
mgnify:CR=1 FL=1